MSHIQLALNVDDLHDAVAFHSKLFSTAPAKIKPGYAGFTIADTFGTAAAFATLPLTDTTSCYTTDTPGGNLT